VRRVNTETPIDPALPLVVVAGRPNVGKSSLVNRVVGRRVAVVQAEPGVTRDRKILAADWTGTPFRLVDTGGWLAGGDALSSKVSAQAERALADADLILFVVDATVGITEEAQVAARMVRRAGAPVRLVANKADGENRDPATWEFVSLGLGDPWPISALHGRGVGDLLDEVVRVVANHAPEGSLARSDAPAVPRVALVGRPNAGKSTLFNKLIGEDRSIVHDQPGTTRDSIDTVIETPEGPLCFVDTAGMRKPSKTDFGTEHYSVLRALDALEGADLAMLVIDGTVGATHQDQRLAERIGVSGSPAVVIVNKWDLVEEDQREDVLAGVGDRLAFLGAAPVLRVSARSGRGVHRILPALFTSVEAYHHRIATGALNRALGDLQSATPAPGGARIRYGVQGAIDPPTFTLFATARLSPQYLRYVERSLRERFALGPTPIKLRVRLGGGR
jgi:GTP-binding protein